MRDHRPLRLLIASSALVGTVGGGCGRDPDGYVYDPPQARSDGLPVADATVMGIDTSRIGSLVRPFLTDRFGKHMSLLVMKNGRLIVEEYFGSGNRRQRHGVQSVSKSITSLLVGHGLAQRYIESIDDPIAKYLPTYQHLLTGGKEKITVRHLLTMTSGLAWNEWDTPYGDSTNMRTRERHSSDAVAFVLSRPLGSQPGETRTYNGGGMTLLFEMLKNTSGLLPEVLLQRAFDGLLGRDEIRPTFQQDGRVNAAGGFQVTPRGMAKIGQMVLQGGVWHGDTLFDPAWIRESTGAFIGRGRIGYGYLWWRHSITVGDRAIEATVANGLGGQYIVILPDLEVVIAVTADNYDRPTPLDTLIEHVLSALGPFHLTSGRVVRSPAAIDSAAAYPPSTAGWSEVLSAPNPGNDGALIRVAVDTLAARRLDDGSYLVWLQTVHEKPQFEAGRTYNRRTSRFILRCKTPTDGHYKGVSTTGFLNEGPPVFQDAVGVTTAMAQPWVPAWGGTLDLTIFQRACSRVSRRQ